MVSKEVVVKSETGLHARPAAVFVKTCESFPCSVFVEVGEKKINAKSILNILACAIKGNSKITIICDGEREEEALETIADLVENKLED